MINSQISYLHPKKNLSVQGEKNKQKVKNIKCIHKSIHEYEYFWNVHTNTNTLHFSQKCSNKNTFKIVFKYL